eukprot:SAG31_NODE_4901_length_2877_cov_1.289777_3_plen_171_part_01
MMCRLLCGATWGALTASASAAPTSSVTATAVSLDGRWDFALGTTPEQLVAGKILVPGGRDEQTGQVIGPSWQAQGFGPPGPDIKHGLPCPNENCPREQIGRFSRKVVVPHGWLPLTPAQQLVIWFGGIHRSANVSVNGKPLAKHVGYLTPFEVDITALAKTSTPLRLEVNV